MLRGINLACIRGERPLFAGVDIAVDAGEWLHVRGANGVGKTSLLRLLAGLSQPAEGEILWDGVPIRSSASTYHSNLLFLGHHGALKEELTAFENIELAGALDGSPSTDAELMGALRRFGLQGREDLPVRVLSAGQKRRVLLARLLTRKARLWVLDEPFTALDTRAVDMLGALLGEHMEGGGMAVITSHQNVPLEGGRAVNLDQAVQHAARVAATQGAMVPPIGGTP